MELKGPLNSLKHSSQPTLSQCPHPLLHCNSDSSDRASPPLSTASAKVILPNHTLSHWIPLQEHILLLPWSISWSVPGSPCSSAWRWAMKKRVQPWLTRSVHTSGKQRKKKSKINVGFPLDLTERFWGAHFKKSNQNKPHNNKRHQPKQNKKNRGMKGFFSQMQQSQNRKLPQ